MSCDDYSFVVENHEEWLQLDMLQMSTAVVGALLFRLCSTDRTQNMMKLNHPPLFFILINLILICFIHAERILSLVIFLSSSNMTNTAGISGIGETTNSWN